MKYGYARVSTDKKDQLNSLENQVALIEKMFEKIDDEEGGIFIDKNVSAKRFKLSERLGGKQLTDAVRDGDHVVAVDATRLWRQDDDRKETKKCWSKLGITLHHYGMVPIAPKKRLMAEEKLVERMSGAVSEYTSDKIGDGVHRVQVEAHHEEKPYGACRPCGWMVVNKEYVENQKEREICKLIIRLKDDEGYSWARIHLHLRFAGIRKPVTQKDSSGLYHEKDLRRCYQRAKAGYPKKPLAPSSIDDYA